MIYNLKKIISCLLFCIAFSANAIEYTVHHAPGGVSDRIARLISKELPSSEYIVQNRPGGAGRIAVRHVLKGESILVATIPQIYVTNPLNFKDLEYDPNTDLEIVGTIGILPNLLICNTKTGIRDFQSLVNSTKSLSFAIGGYGGSDHIATELLLTKLKGKHVIVPYGGGGNKSALDVLGGSVDCTFGNYATVKPFMKDEKVVALFASHNMGDNVLSWEKYFKETFPYQSFISLVVSTSMNSETKAKVIKDIKIIWEKKEFREQTFNMGILPVLSTDQSVTSIVLKSNKELNKFITGK
jgi:tripartite-type tricarboxylate transporter receptor subunit TctC